MSLPLMDALRQCHLHAGYLQAALSDLPHLVTEQTLKQKDAALIRALDQLVLRYIKLQDTLGEHVLRALAVQVLLEPVEDLPLADVLNRLEKHGVLTVTEWLAHRKLRNALTHEYPDQIERQASVLNETMVRTNALVTLLASVQSLVDAR